MFQELQRIKAEVESANEFQTRKDSLTLRLQVRVKLPPPPRPPPTAASSGGRRTTSPAPPNLCFQDTEARNRALEAQLRELEQRLDRSQQEREAFHHSLRSLLQLLDGKISELTELRDTLAKIGRAHV